jgi:hypothetical protein
MEAFEREKTALGQAACFLRLALGESDTRQVVLGHGTHSPIACWERGEHRLKGGRCFLKHVQAQVKQTVFIVDRGGDLRTVESAGQDAPGGELRPERAGHVSRSLRPKM